jgi:hypothetical protein
VRSRPASLPAAGFASRTRPQPAPSRSASVPLRAVLAAASMPPPGPLRGPLRFLAARQGVSPPVVAAPPRPRVLRRFRRRPAGDANQLRRPQVRDSLASPLLRAGEAAACTSPRREEADVHGASGPRRLRRPRGLSLSRRTKDSAPHAQRTAPAGGQGRAATHRTLGRSRKSIDKFSTEQNTTTPSYHSDSTNHAPRGFESFGTMRDGGWPWPRKIHRLSILRQATGGQTEHKPQAQARDF